MPPFLSVITRTMASRPTMLARNKASLLAQSCQDFEHLVFTDPEGHGHGNGWAQKWIVELGQKTTGRYVMILDDDDLMANPEGVAILKETCNGENPRGVIFRADYGNGKVIPVFFEGFDRGFWPLGQVGQLCYILREDIFKESSYVYQRGLDETDYLCLLDAYDNAKAAKKLMEFSLRNEVINAAQRADSRGRPE